MNRPFAIYPNSFDGSTLGYWRFGEGGGALAGVVGNPMVAYGTPPPVALDDGYRIDRDPSSYLRTDCGEQPSRKQVTWEAWIRDWKTPTGMGGRILEFRCGYASGQRVYLIFTENGASSSLAVTQKTGGYAVWSGQAVYDLLTSPEPWHVAICLDSESPHLRLFVNGVQRAQGLTGLVDMAAGNYYLYIGESGVTYSPACVVDEVRLSAADRYVGGTNGVRYFTPPRYGEGRRAGLRGPGEMVEIAGGCV